jgi:TRAP-type C4-dicarboxylate transport system permease large subunit
VPCVAVKLGIDCVHFAMIVIYNLTPGMITPAVGDLLFVPSNYRVYPWVRWCASLFASCGRMARC